MIDRFMGIHKDRFLTSRELKPRQRPRSACELLRLDSQPLEHADEQIGQRLVVLLAKLEVMAVFKTATSKQDGQVFRVVVVSVAEVASEKEHRAVEQRGSCFFAIAPKPGGAWKARETEPTPDS